MNTPDWLKPGIYGAISGAIGIGVIGFTWGGWITSGSASRMAHNLAYEYALFALVPVCLDLVRTDPNYFENISKVETAVYFERADAVMKAGWATVPGSGEPNRHLAQACLAQLKLNVSD
jgi:hypothetical protein